MFYIIPARSEAAAIPGMMVIVHEERRGGKHMSLRFVAGGSGAGKSTALYQEIIRRSIQAVSYTHLDVYKRQRKSRSGAFQRANS